MTLTLNIPDLLLRRLEAVCDNVPRALLEGFAADAYRAGTLSRAEVGQLLEHESIWQTEAFLSAHEAWPAPTFDEVGEDIAAVRRLCGGPPPDKSLGWNESSDATCSAIRPQSSAWVSSKSRTHVTPRP